MYMWLLLNVLVLKCLAPKMKKGKQEGDKFPKQGPAVKIFLKALWLEESGFIKMTVKTTTMLPISVCMSAIRSSSQ